MVILYILNVLVTNVGSESDSGFRAIGAAIQARILRNDRNSEAYRLVSDPEHAVRSLQKSVSTVSQMWAAVVGADAEAGDATASRPAPPATSELVNGPLAASQRVGPRFLQTNDSNNASGAAASPECAPYAIETVSLANQDVCNGLQVTPQVRQLLEAIDSAGTNGTIARLALQALEAVLDEEALEALIPENFTVPAALNLSQLLTPEQQAAVLEANNISSLDDIRTIR